MALRPYFLFNPRDDLEDGIAIPEEVLDEIERWFNNMGGRRHEIKYWDPIDDSNDYPALARYLDNNNGGGAVPVLITWW